MYLFFHRKETSRYTLSKSSSWHSASVLRELRSNKPVLEEKVNQAEILFVILIPCICHLNGHKNNNIIMFVLESHRERKPIVSECVCTHIHIHVYLSVYWKIYIKELISKICMASQQPLCSEKIEGAVYLILEAEFLFLRDYVSDNSLTVFNWLIETHPLLGNLLYSFFSSKTSFTVKSIWIHIYPVTKYLGAMTSVGWYIILAITSSSIFCVLGDILSILYVLFIWIVTATSDTYWVY